MQKFTPFLWFDGKAEETGTIIPLTAARLSIAAVITYQLTLIALIFIRPELDPTWHTISEWAIGPYGWIMSLAFLISAVSYGSLFVAVKSQIPGILGKIGLGLLLICTIGTVGVGVFTIQAMLEQMRAAIMEAAPEAEEVISYAMPAYKLNGMLVSFAGYEKHIGFYPGAGGIAAFKDEIAAYKWAKGSVQFPLDKPLPLKLITRIVKFRVNQNLEKTNKK